jgi:phage baseplate assembly protein W
MSEDFIGSGIAFPLRTDPTGRLALVSKDRELEESVRLILGTAPGERPMRPQFGCGIHDYVFATPDPGTMGRMALEVISALERWEPRIDVSDVQVTPDKDDPARLYIAIKYLVGDLNDPRNLVFPFYTIPAEEDL